MHLHGSSLIEKADFSSGEWKNSEAMFLIYYLLIKGHIYGLNPLWKGQKQVIKRTEF